MFPLNCGGTEDAAVVVSRAATAMGLNCGRSDNAVDENDQLDSHWAGAVPGTPLAALTARVDQQQQVLVALRATVPAPRPSSVAA